MGLDHLKDISAIIDDLDAMGRLIRIKSEVDINLDLAGIAAEFKRAAMKKMSLDGLEIVTPKIVAPKG